MVAKWLNWRERYLPRTNPFVGYTLSGIGAAAYSPAKYGILGELDETGDKLVKANGLMGFPTIAAILLVPSRAASTGHVIAALVTRALALRWRSGGEPALSRSCGAASVTTRGCRR